MGDIYKNETAYTYKMDKINAIYSNQPSKRAKSAKTFPFPFCHFTRLND